MRKFAFLLSIFLLFSATASAQSVELLWQGDGYVPPFYKGRSAWSQQTTLTLLAVPQGLGNPASLNYRWSQNGTVLGSLSGVGKNTLSIRDTILSKSQRIGVEIVGSNSDTLASSVVVLTPREPALLAYENHPLYGILFNNEVSGTYIMKGSEITLTGFPLFFSVKSIADQNLTYKWQTSGSADNQNSVTYRVPEGTSGSSLINASIAHKSNVLQVAQKKFLIQFGKETE
jgi:hypothetical protein